MNIILQKKAEKVLRAVAVLMLILIAAAPMTARAADSQVSLSVGQAFSASSLSAYDTFTYRLRPLDPDNPMPAGSAADGYTFTITGNGSAVIGPLTFDRQGVCRYEVYQVINAQGQGYLYDRRVYTVEIYADALLRISVIIKNANGVKEDNIIFENGYSALPTDPKLMVDPPVMKTVSGSPARDSVFEFRLAAQSSSQPMPAGSANGVKTLRITGPGRGEFGTWIYDKAGVYYYTVYEVNSKASGYIYDTAVYTITDTVRDENGRLTLTRVVTNGTNKPVASMVFNNRYKSGGGAVEPPAPTGPPGTVNPPKPTGPPGTVEPPKPTGPPGTVNPPKPTGPPGTVDPSKPTGPPGTVDPPKPTIKPGTVDPSKPGGGPSGIQGPKTGDDSNDEFYITVFASGGVLSLGAALYLIMGGKRGKAR